MAPRSGYAGICVSESKRTHLALVETHAEACLSEWRREAAMPEHRSAKRRARTSQPRKTVPPGNTHRRITNHVHQRLQQGGVLRMVERSDVERSEKNMPREKYGPPPMTDDCHKNDSQTAIK